MIERLGPRQLNFDPSEVVSGRAAGSPPRPSPQERGSSRRRRSNVRMISDSSADWRRFSLSLGALGRGRAFARVLWNSILFDHSVRYDSFDGGILDSLSTRERAGVRRNRLF